jgi:hypothetical protein
LQFLASPKQKVLWTSFNRKKLGALVCDYHPSDGRKTKIEIGSWFMWACAKKQDLAPKQPEPKGMRAWLK